MQAQLWYAIRIRIFLIKKHFCFYASKFVVIWYWSHLIIEDANEHWLMIQLITRCQKKHMWMATDIGEVFLIKSLKNDYETQPSTGCILAHVPIWKPQSYTDRDSQYKAQVVVRPTQHVHVMCECLYLKTLAFILERPPGLQVIENCMEITQVTIIMP